jgi:hypothetical protein
VKGRVVPLGSHKSARCIVVHGFARMANGSRGQRLQKAVRETHSNFSTALDSATWESLDMICKTTLQGSREGAAREGVLKKEKQAAMRAG